MHKGRWISSSIFQLTKNIRSITKTTIDYMLQTWSIIMVAAGLTKSEICGDICEPNYQNTCVSHIWSSNMPRSPIKSFIRSKKPHPDGRTSCNCHLGKPRKVQLEGPQGASRMSTHPKNDPTSEIKPTELAERVEHARIDRSLNYLLKTIENNWAL